MSEAAAGTTARRRAGAARWLTLGLAALVIDLALIQPNHPAAMTWGARRLFPPILLGLAALRPKARTTVAVRAVIVALLVVSFVLGTADYATYVALSRPFHPLLDLHLLVSGWHLGRGALGAPLMAGAMVVAVAATAGSRRCSGGRPAGGDPPRRGWVAAGAAATGLAAVAAIGHGCAWSLPARPPGGAFMARHLIEQVEDHRAAIADLRAFRAEGAGDPWADAAPLLDRIGRRDVVMLFVESYGASSLTDPLYSLTHRETLAGIQDELAAQGVAMRSAWLADPPLTPATILPRASSRRKERGGAGACDRSAGPRCADRRLELDTGHGSRRRRTRLADERFPRQVPRRVQLGPSLSRSGTSTPVLRLSSNHPAG